MSAPSVRTPPGASPFTLVAARVVTCDESRATAGNALGALEPGAVTIADGKIAWIGPPEARDPNVPVTDVGGAVVTPGLIDAHTHLAWAGSRHGEYAVRMAGGDYEAIAKAGGGIVSTFRAVADTSPEALVELLRARLLRAAQLGVTTCEVKSGYGLLPEHELKQLRAIAACTNRPELPAVVPTFLALHALPPEARADRGGYVRRVVEELLPRVREENLAAFVDAYLDASAFQIDEGRALGEKARALGFHLRLHVGQFADIGGAELAAELGAHSVDHLEQVSGAGIAALARAGTHAVLLPIASFTLKQAPPPVAKLRAAGVPLVVASDANPGTAPTESLPLALALGVRNYDLTPEEAILGATRWAARSLDLPQRGALRRGAQADLVVWDLPHEHAIVQPWGTPRTRLVLRDGAPIFGRLSL
ncbi:imidazolonepropionase [Pendulispora albinea]|uniref:Imidazolonepropionase n=1 Tax=Pendulispora albinea TaxID=2741071 RepID=A0ABZ2M989_9BACT